MLGRVADQLYWMARYSERAENMARMLDVADRMTLTPQSPETRDSAWFSALEVAGAQEGYAEKHGEIAGKSVLHFMALDSENPASIYSSILSARENARALRGSITTEVFEAINATWLELRSMDAAVLQPSERRVFFDWVKERSHLFRGVADGTMLRDEAMKFMAIGLDIERADNTARLLDSKYHILLPSIEEVGGALDYYQWGALLRSLSAFRAYHKIYRDRIVSLKVAELIILHAEMPRSMRCSYDRLMANLADLCGDDAPECERLAGRIHSLLKFRRIDEIFRGGLHEFLTEFIEGNAEVGQQIARDFMMVR
ncbi:MAG: alpha-E domain-containing protein [Rhodospirillaceae bacterium]